MKMHEEREKFRTELKSKPDDFAAAPTPFQQEWMLRRALREFTDDMEHLDGMLPGFVSGEERRPITDDWRNSLAALDAAELSIQDQQVMQAWEHPLMERLAQIAGQSHGDVLEVGFGMGISATYLQAVGVRSYTVIECNDAVVENCEKWRASYPDSDIRIVKGMWQDVKDQLDEYDGILFDTYPVSQAEYLRNEVNGTAYTHAGEFFPIAADILRPGGVFTYFTCEIETLSRGHQRLLLDYFDSFKLGVVRGLEPPEGCQYWWADSMAVVEAFKE